MTESFRIEKDTMGEMQVPSSALYGAQTARAVDNFPVSFQGIPSLCVRALGMIKAAAAVVNEREGLLEPALAKVIRAAAAEVIAGALDAQFVVDVFQTGSGTSSNMNANEVIANRASQLLGKPLGSNAVHPNDHVNMGQSSNDVFPSAVQLALIIAGQDQLLPQMSALAAALHDFADQSWAQVKTGRTHLMDAMPIRFGQEFRGYAQQVEQGMLRVQQALDGLRQLPLGGTAVGTGVNSKPGFAARMCEVIGQDYGYLLQESEQHFHAQACLDAVVQASGAMRTFATGLYKFTNDVRWMSSSSLGELAIPAVQPGSSIMPAKVNPVICESVLMVCGQVLGNDVAVAFGNSQGQFELNTMMPFMARNAVESATLLANACMVLRTRCLAGMRVTEVATGAVHRNPILATALNAKIGYEAAAKLAKEAAASGKTILELARTKTNLDAATLATLLDPARLCGEWGRNR